MKNILKVRKTIMKTGFGSLLLREIRKLYFPWSTNAKQYDWITKVDYV